jgi:hypothetical protein
LGVFGRLPPVELTVSPPVVRPGQTIRAKVTVPTPLDDVASAAVQWGYRNFHDGAGAVDVDEWVGISTDRLAISLGRFLGATCAMRVPAGAPASSAEIARWLCRLRLSRRGRDITAEADFDVVIAAADVATGTAAVHRVDGAAGTILDIALPWAVFRAGDTIRGHIRLTPTRDLSDGDLAICWHRERLSHSMNGSPCSTASLTGPIVKLGSRIPLRAGAPVAVPFELTLPLDAAPTASAVHSSLAYFVVARLRYAGTGSRAERVRCPIVVVNAG